MMPVFSQPAPVCRPTLRRLVAASLMLLVAAGCTPDTELTELMCETDTDCADDAECIDGFCVRQQVGPQLIVLVYGVPDEINADVTVQGPDGYNVAVTGATLLDELEPGTYELLPRDVESGPARFRGESVSVEVGYEEQVTAEVHYRALPGDLVVETTGLPAGTTPGIEIADADGESIGDVAVGEPIEELAPGYYTVAGEPMSVAGEAHSAPPLEAAVYSEQHNTATLEYLSEFGRLAVDVTGLPDGVDHEIEILPDDVSESIRLPQSGELSTVEPGEYTVRVHDVDDGLDVYAADDRSVTVERDATSTVDVDYQLVPADLTVDITGLPDGVDADVEVSGPQFVETLQSSNTFEQLLSGVYDIAPHPVDVDQAVFDADFETIELPGGAEMTAFVDYEPTDGELVVEIDLPAADPTGEPISGSATFEIVDADDQPAASFQADADTESVEVDLAPGTYRIALVDTTLSDHWDNDFPESGFHGLGAEFDIESESTNTRDLSSPLPTEVVTENDGDSDTGSLREVAGRVNDGSLVVFSDGIADIALDGEPITIDRPLQILGGGEVTVRSSDGDEPLFFVGGIDAVEAEILFQGLTLRDGAGVSGGAVETGSVTGTQVRFYGVELTDNSAYTTGGAVYVGSQTEQPVLFVDTVFSDNAADDGAAIYIDDGARVRLRDTSFDSNVADSEGGAVYAGGALWARGVLFASNTAAEHGGAVFATDTVSVEQSTFSANVAAAGHGGALFAAATAGVSLLHVTMVENSVGEDGAGLYVAGAEPVVAKSSLFAGHFGGDDIAVGPSSAPVQSQGFNAVSDHVLNAFTPTATDQMPADVTYLPLADNGGFSRTHAVWPGSAGYLDIAAAHCRTIEGQFVRRDQRRSPRPAGSACTRGAWEADAHRESFRQAGVDDQPSTGSFTGEGDRLWHYTDAADAGDDAIDGMGIRLVHSSSEISSGDVEGIDGDAVESLSFPYRPIGGADIGRIEIVVDGELIDAVEFGTTGGAVNVIAIAGVGEVSDELVIRNAIATGASEPAELIVGPVTWR